MKTPLVALLLSSAVLALGAGTAQACPNGYKRVTIQGNHVCQLDASASTNLKAQTKGGGTEPSSGPKRTVR